MFEVYTSCALPKKSYVFDTEEQLKEFLNKCWFLSDKCVSYLHTYTEHVCLDEYELVKDVDTVNIRKERDEYLDTLLKTLSLMKNIPTRFRLNSDCCLISLHKI